MTAIVRRRLLRASAALLIVSTAPALAQTTVKPKDQSMTSLFKIISVKDEIVIGLMPDELSGLGGNDAGAIAKALVSKGSLSVWQYSVRKGADGDLEQAPRVKIGLIAHDSLRVEPYASPLRVVAHE